VCLFTSTVTVRCEQCDEMRRTLAAVLARLDQIESERDALRSQLGEAMKLVELQRADIERYKEQYERVRPNHPERVPQDELQLVFDELLVAFGEKPAANDAGAEDAAAPPADPPVEGEGATGTGKPPPRKRHEHGRRRLDLTKLPVELLKIDPPEVTAAGGVGFDRIGEEVSERVAHRPASYIRLRISRGKWVVTPVTPEGSTDPAAAEDSTDTAETPPVLVAPLPESVWPHVMADPSAIAAAIIGKYDDCLPLNRQERISARQGFPIPRSTLCSWLTAACSYLGRIADAMFAEAKSQAFCIATDATGAPVRAVGACENWHVFVFIADRDHVVFRYLRSETSVAVSSLLSDFHGYLLSDAAPVYDALHRGGDVIEVCCWSHARRYFYRALETERSLALAPLSIISKLFELERECRLIPMPERTTVRATRAAPLLALLDRWIDEHRDQVDPRGPLDKAIGYYENQREGLHRFLDDGRLRLDNNLSEQQLRKLVLGNHNWGFFANETGLRWYTVFRSLIASCHLHGIEPQRYLEQVLRLAPHWPVTRVIELSPKHWSRTLASLDDRQWAIITPPWETPPPASAADGEPAAAPGAAASASDAA
jgi:transposase